MATRLTWRTSDNFRGLRPFNLRRDLHGVVDLVLLAFANEPERSGGQASQEELRTLKHLAPLIWLSSLLSDQARNFFAGFVWEEDGRLVGNASISKVGHNRSRWMIGNVAVHPDFRRQGIARQLTVAAADFARASGAQVAMLDVRADNDAAYHLYRSLGFKRIGGTTELKLTGWNGASAESLKSALSSEDGLIKPVFRGLRQFEWQPVYDLACAAAPALAQAYNPVPKTDYQIGPAQGALTGISHFLARRHDYRLLAINEGDRPAAFLEVSVRGVKLSHRVRIIIHPDYRGRIERALALRAMDILRYHPWSSVWAEIPSDHSEQIETLKSCGFKETTTLHRLGLRLTG